jgi:predicted amino acid dehydrogenase
VSRSPVEVKLARVLEELLNLESVPRDADFFALGGTSLLGMRYVIRINDIFRINLGAADLVRAPTIALMAQLVADRLSADVMEPSARLGTASDAAIGQKLWRPLALARAEGAFDEINAAAVIYLPDDLLEQARRLGAESSLRRQLPAAEDAQWVAVARLPFGRIALVLIPRFGSDLIANPAGAVDAVDAAAQQAQRLGAKTAALTGIIPTITDFGRALTPPADLTITTGHGTTASAIVLTSLAAAQAAGRFLPGETVAFVGLGAIGSATLRLMLDLAIHPRALVLCDVPAKRAELERLAAEAADGGFRGETIIACAGARLSEDVYRASFIVGATNAPGLLAVDQLARGTIVVDDSFPHCFDVTNAMARMATQRDVLLVEGGLVSPPGTIDWQMALPPNLTLFGGGAVPNLLPDAMTITGCILSSLLSDHACATVGPVSVAHSRAHWDAMARLGIGSAPLRCAGWLPGDAYLDQFRARFGRTGG